MNAFWDRIVPERIKSNWNFLVLEELVPIQKLYIVMADIVLAVHALYVVFIVGGVFLIFAGAFAGWSWITNFWFRTLHLAAIGIVTVQSWLEILCPLTTLEIYFREKASQESYDTTFIAYWLHRLLYYDAPMWLFSLCYTLFGLAVIATWIYIPPRLSRGRTSHVWQNKR